MKDITKMRNQMSEVIAKRKKTDNSIESQRFIVESLEGDPQPNVMTPDSSTASYSSHFTPSPKLKPPALKKQRANDPYSKKPNSVDYGFADTSLDEEFGLAAELAEKRQRSATLARTRAVKRNFPLLQNWPKMRQILVTLARTRVMKSTVR